MSKKNTKTHDFLLDFGFKGSKKDEKSLILDIKSSQSRLGNNFHLASCLKLQIWKLRKKDDQWMEAEISIRIDIPFLIESIVGVLKKKYGRQTKLDIVPAHDQGVWILAEFTQSRVSKDLTKKHADSESQHYPHGVMGIHLNMNLVGKKLLIHFSNHFMVGYHPAKIFFTIKELIIDNLVVNNRKNEVEVGLFEVCIDVSTIFADIRKNLPDAAKELLVEADVSPEPEITFETGKGWLVTSSDKIFDTNKTFFVPPIEVAETRSLRGKYSDLDQLILNGKMEAGKKICIEYLEDDSSSVFLLRRLCLISFWEKRLPDSNLLKKMILLDPKNNLFISMCIQNSLQTGDKEELLKNLSFLGELLYEQIPNFEDNSIFGLVFPELLGDGWRQKDDRISHICYNKAIESRGEIPRLLRKIANIAKESGDSVAEIEILMRIISIEKSNSRIAEIHFRIAQLSRAIDLDRACDSAMCAWQTNPKNTDYALFASECLNESKDYRRSIQVLEECSNKISNIKNLEKRLMIEVTIAKNWAKYLNRIDLAKERLINAIEINSENIQFLIECEKCAIELDIQDVKVDIQEKIFFLAIAKKNVEQVFSKFDSLANHYKKAADSEMKKKLLYQTLIENYLIDKQRLDEVLQMNDVNLDWSLFVKNINKQVANLNWDERKPYLLFLAEVCISKLNDKDLAASFYEKYLEYGEIDVSVFDFLNDYYAIRKKFDKRENLIKRKLKESVGEQRRELLHDLCYSSETLKEPEKDMYSLMMLEEFNDFVPFKKRIVLHREKNNLAAIDGMYEDLQKESIGVEDYLDLTKYGLSIVQEMHDSARFRVINNMVKEIEASYTTRIEWLEMVVGYLCNGDANDEFLEEKRKYAEPYLSEMILAGITPGIDRDEVAAILQPSSPAKALYNLYLSNIEEDEKIALFMLREALGILKDEDDYSSHLVQLLQNISRITLLNLSELELFYELCQKQGLIEIFLDCFESQMKRVVLESDYRNLKSVFLKVIEDNPSECFNLLDGLHVLIKNYDWESLPEIYKNILEINFEYKKYLDRSWALEFLGEIQNFGKDRDFYREALRWTLEDPSNIEKVESMFMLFQNNMQENKDFVNLRSLVDLGLEFEISFRHTLWTVFTEASNARDESRFRYWLCLLGKIEKESQWRRVFLHLKRMINDEKEVLVLLRYAYDAEEKLAKSVFQEVKIEFGLALLNLEVDLSLSHKLLYEAYKLNKKDKRLWIPLYNLQSSLNLKNDNYDLLHFIIPKLSEKPHLLEEHSLSLESMVMTFKKIAHKLDKSDLLLGFDSLAKRAKSKRKNTIQSITDGMSEVVKNIKISGKYFVKESKDSKERSGISKAHILPNGNEYSEVDKSGGQGVISSRTRDRKLDSDMILKTDSGGPSSKVTIEVSDLQDGSDSGNPLIESPASIQMDHKDSINSQNEDSDQDQKTKGGEEMDDETKIQTGKDLLDSSGFYSKQPKPSNQSVANDKWRLVLRDLSNKKMLPELFKLEYKSKFDRYLAYQGGVFNDQSDFDILSKFNWLDYVRPWDSEQDSAYIPKLEIMQWILRFKEKIEKSYQETVNLNQIASHFSSSLDQLLANREYIMFKDLFSWPWAEVYHKQMSRLPVKLVFVVGPDSLIYESRQKVLYVGKSLAISPSAILLHSILFHMRAIQASVHELVYQPNVVRKVLGAQIKKVSSNESRELAKLLARDEFHRQVDHVKDLLLRQLLRESRNLVDLARFEKTIFANTRMPEKRKRILLAQLSKIIDED